MKFGKRAGRRLQARTSTRGYGNGSVRLGDGLANYSRSPSAAPSTRNSLLTELAMKQASCAL